MGSGPADEERAVDTESGVSPPIRAVGGRETVRAAVVVGALGVVFGDIGTSPIYTIQTVFNPEDPHPVPISTNNVYGVVSLIFWSVMIIVTLTYVLLVMRADNDGEGGIMALITLLRRLGGARGRRVAAVLAGLGIFGAALFFGDSMITPAISVLSAVEGLKVVQPGLEELIVPITAVIIVVLFAVQRRGTAAVGRLFGPVMIVWFLAIGACGVAGIARAPGDPRGAVADLCAELHGRALRDRLLRAGRGRARGHRRRGAVRRHGPLRPPGDHPRLAAAGPAGVRAELPRPGRADPRRPERREQPVLPARPGLGAVADGAAGHRGDGDRLPGGDHRRLLGGVAGRPARLPAEAAGGAHLGVDDRPDLRSVDQLGADGVGADAGVRLPQLGGVGVRVRHGGDRDDHHHHAAVLLPRPDQVAALRCGWS